LNLSTVPAHVARVRTPIEPARPGASRFTTVDEFSSECVEFFGEAVQLFGVPHSVGQIYGLLYASQKPLSFSDIIERLDISKGSASQGLNLLRSLGAVHMVTPVGANGRREYFSPEFSLRKLVRGVLDERVTPLTNKSAGRLARLCGLAHGAAESERKFRLGRVQQLETWRRRLKTVVPVLIALLGPNSRQ